MKKTMFLAAMFALTFVVDNQASAQATAVKEVTVDATKKAVDTGVKLDVGDWVEVTEVTGKVYMNKPAKPENATGMEGWTQFKPTDTCLFANATPSSLVGYIGDSKSHYQVRKSQYVEAKAAGNLFFAVNDQPASYGDNSGEFVVSYKIIKKDLIRSKELGGRLNITWTNKTGVPITVNWIDFDGKERPSTAGIVEPNKDFGGETGVGHICRGRGDKKAEICLIEVEATSEKVNIHLANPALAQPPKAMVGALGMKFVSLPKATFYMGWNGTNGSDKKTEIREGFKIAIHTVTQGQWQEVMGSNPSHFSRKGLGQEAVKEIKDEDLKQFPVEQVSWDDAQAFIKRLNAREKGKGLWYRLPMEEEWEYACRGGATTKVECSFHFYFEKPTNDLSSREANFRGEKPDGKAEPGPFLGRTTKVGSYKPNKLGLYDMHGNVWQWCEDLNTSRRVPEGVVRGGSWKRDGGDCRPVMFCKVVASWGLNDVGFRLAAVPEVGAK